MTKYTTYQCPVCEEIEFPYEEEDEVSNYIIEHLEAHLENRERNHKKKVD